MIKYYTIRFHKQHDADIVSFIKYNHFNVVKAVKAALTAYAMRQYFYMNINDYIYDRIPKEKNKYVYQLKLDDISDADVSIFEEEKADEPIIEDNGFDDLTDLFTSLIS